MYSYTNHAVKKREREREKERERERINTDRQIYTETEDKTST